MELTIDELAQRSGMTGRNIRQWQTNGLIPPPQRRGRVGIYTEDHLARIGRVKELRAQGFPLDLIRRVLDAPGMDVEADVRHLAAGALAPFAGAERIKLSGTELDERVGRGVVGHLQEAGLAESAGDGDAYLVDSAILAFIDTVVSAGVPASAFVSTLAKAQSHQRAIASLVLESARDELWRPFVDAGMPSGKWHDLADAVDRLREVGLAAASYMFARALDEVMTGVLVDEAGRLRKAATQAATMTSTDSRSSRA
jgi:DNA-binding transcriptional MerR regulator